MNTIRLPPHNHQSTQEHKLRFWGWIVRSIILFILGVVLVIYSMLTPGHDIPFLVTAMVLFGIIPVDGWLERYPHRHKPPEP
jgi:hypothetical protein